MIERGKRSKLPLYEDLIICPNCGNTLVCIGDTRKCTSCDYELSISEIDYTQQHSRSCMICGGVLNQNEQQICERCKEKIKKNLEVIK